MHYRRNELRFECTGCGACCYGADDYVYVTEDDVERIRTHLDISDGWMRRRYLAHDPDGETVLAAEPDGRCVFLDDDARCRIYRARPVQCRTYPFWPEIVASRGRWRRESQRCEGIGRGRIVPTRDIERALAALRRAKLAPDT